jgi:DNA-binding MarR family transcriptional regulator
MSTQNAERAEITAGRLHSAAVRLLRSMRAMDATGTLNAPRLSALSVIVFAGPITLGNLAEAEQVRPPTMTRIVNALESLGLAAKKIDEKDRRSILISATTRGKRTLVEARRRRIRWLAVRISSLHSREQAALRNAIVVMTKIITASKPRRDG